MSTFVKVSLSLKTAKLLAAAARKRGISQDQAVAEAICQLVEPESVETLETDSADWLNFDACAKIAQEHGRYWRSRAALYKFITEATNKGHRIAKAGGLINRVDFEAALRAIPSRHNRTGFQGEQKALD